MKLPAFRYLRADTAEEAAGFLEEYGPDAKLIAGGQSLLPLMRLRLLAPQVIIDISRLSELRYLRKEEDGLRIGSLTRHIDLERSRLDHPFDVVSKLAHNIGHLPIRTSGSFGGSIAHADPAAELALLCIGLDATIELRSTAGSRIVSAGDFFVSMFETVLKPGEVVVDALLPRPPDPSFGAFDEVSIRPGDFALASVLATGHLDEDGVVDWMRLAVGAVEGRPRRLSEVEGLLVGTSLAGEDIDDASRMAAQSVAPLADDEADLRVRKHLVHSLVKRTLGDVRSQADLSSAGVSLDAD